jgi:hypothetical protein
MPIITYWIAFPIGLITSTGLLLHRNWRWGIGLLAAQYLCVFWLTQGNWPVSMAATKLVTGWMVCAVLVIAQITTNKSKELEESWPQGRLFRLFSTGIIMTSTYALSIKASEWLGVDFPISWGSLLLIGMGILQLGISANPFRVILGLLTTISGFEILYAAVESSTLVAAFLSVINLGLGLAGAYLLNLNQENNP